MWTSPMHFGNRKVELDKTRGLQELRNWCRLNSVPAAKIWSSMRLEDRERVRACSRSTSPRPYAQMYKL